jgi:aminopeptidase N
MEINNFYTVTVYEKGAEVVRLYHTLLGSNGFRKGMDLYFKRHDGQAVTTEDFLSAMADANDTDLSHMQVWYEQAGTPRVQVSLDYDAAKKTCTLHCKQSCPNTPESKDKKPFLIPLKAKLLGKQGKALADEKVLLFKNTEQSFVFKNISEKPIPSLLRDFSAPVILTYDYSDNDYAFLMQYDDNAFNRWNAAQALASNTILKLMQGVETSFKTISQAFKKLLQDQQLEPALRAEALNLPSLSDIQEAWLGTHDSVNPEQAFQAREILKTALAQALHADFLHIYQGLQPQGLSDKAMQQRKLKNVCLAYLVQNGAYALAYQQFQDADNMTAQYAALALLAHHDCPEQALALQAFEQQWQDENNVMDKWFGVQASAPLPDTLKHVQNLMQHPQFTMANPNKVRALIGGFAMRNPKCFHAQDGSGYSFVAEQVLALDKLNPQVAARMVRALMDWKRLEPKRKALMKEQLQRIADSKGLSGDVFEIASKSL